MSATSGEKLLLSIEEVADLLGFARSYVYRLMDSGEIKTVKVGRRRLVARVDLEEFVERMRTTGQA